MTSTLRAVPSPEKRVPPHNLDAESAVLSAIVVEGANALDRVATFTRPEHFYAEANRQIFSAAQQLRETGKPIDVVTVANVLRERGRMEQIGGAAYLAQISDATPSIANLEAHAVVVVELARVRHLIARCEQIAAMGYGDQDPATFADRVKEAIDLAIARDSTESSGRFTGAAASEIYQRLVAGHASQQGEGLPTGFVELDEHTTGFEPCEVTIIAARPGMGKSSFALSLARNIVYGQVDIFTRELTNVKDVVAFFSLEMPEEQVILRLACIDGGVDNQRLKRRQLSADEWQRFVDAWTRVSQMPIWIDSKPLDLVRLERELRRQKAQHEAQGKRLRLAVIDHIALMGGPEREPYKRIAANSTGIKRIANALKLPIVALCQLNRNTEDRSDKRPGMADLRGAGELEQDADNIWFIYREDYYRERGAVETGEAEIEIAKQRSGPAPRTATLKFYAGCTRFDNA
jgi:replicative DNA helicase